jgi:hypothetical protein
MSNSYKYIDLRFHYIDPKMGLLKNIQDISDPDVCTYRPVSTPTNSKNYNYLLIL